MAWAVPHWEKQLNFWTVENSALLQKHCNKKQEKLKVTCLSQLFVHPEIIDKFARSCQAVIMMKTPDSKEPGSGKLPSIAAPRVIYCHILPTDWFLRRTGIEINILIEKHHGYNYEHCFSYDWKAMKGYHYLMRLAHLINVLAEYSESLVSYIKGKGIRNIILFIRNTLSGPWMQGDIEKRILAPCQLRLL